MNKVEDLTGERFGKLKVIKRDEIAPPGRSKWICRCDCGNLTSVYRNHLTSGTTVSCGCAKKHTNLKELKPGTKFGRLKVMSRTNQKSGNSYKYKCRCDCGNVCFISSAHLRAGSTISCGCLAVEAHKNSSKMMRKRREEFYVDGTDIANIMPRTPRSDNSSGHTGVSWDSSVGTWKAYITFKGKRYYLGSSTDLDTAVAFRKQAEKELHGDFLKWYAITYPDKWAKITAKKRGQDE